ncbi:MULTISPECIES: hypothetical protein [Methylococcus]|uniref:HTH iclR-type domain-containing protein n=1 Tax=Methylococcus capsulatus (strain ATCC 33009 / NCIMB 11132 / Bath) TaxID=243233 RepID=Q602V6_METCA|nr:hypothetical protein [Methylococcus capsulatus]AAU90939.1 hypothetical protein MCA2953 [Methylococcus capsulatus str. Bath]QXP93011.1 hypothetical protein KW113_11655 [Methylococcus capsulatus]
MARKPVTIELAGGKSPRQRIWEMIRKLRIFTVPELRGHLPGPVPLATVRTYVESLHAAGILEKTPGLYELIDDRGIEAPRVNKAGQPVTLGQGNERMWGAMEALGAFNCRVLARMADVPLATVKTYCAYLQRAGFLTVERAGKGRGAGGVPTTYRLLHSRITGPRPPMITRLKTVYDPNVGKIVWQQDPQEQLDD